MSNQLKPIIAALGLALATVSGSAAALTTYGLTNFEDDNVDFVIQGTNTGNNPNALDEGDTLISIFKILQTSDPFGTESALVAPGELSGVAALTLYSFDDLDGGGVDNDMIFSPYAGGLDTWLGGKTVTGGGPGGGAMAALWLDTTEDLITLGSTNCADLADCIARATNGSLYEVDGFTGVADATQLDDGWANLDADEFWVALNADTNIAGVLLGNSTSKFGAFNFGLSFLDKAGTSFIDDGVTCTGAVAALCRGDDKIDVLGSGDVLGGQGLGAGVVADGAFAHSDFDFQKAVPEPATLALLGIGLLGMGASLRRKVR